MQLMDHIAILIVVFLINWGINTWYNSTHKDKDGNAISMTGTAMQSLMSTIIAVLIIFILSTYVLTPAA
jgi:heme/copper-type cytochrome/quinol oxidase subunit 2